MGRIFTANRYASVVSTAALIIALGGGTAYAASLVTSKDIKNGAVHKADIHKSAVTSAKVKDGSLLKTDFAAGQLTAGPKGDKGDKGDTGDTGDTGGLSAVTNRDALLTINGGSGSVDSFCNAGETAVGGSVNIIPDGTGTVTTSRPVGDAFGDSPDNGSAFIGWRGVATGSQAGSLLVVHVFCAS